MDWLDPVPEDWADMIVGTLDEEPEAEESHAEEPVINRKIPIHWCVKQQIMISCKKNSN